MEQSNENSFSQNQVEQKSQIMLDKQESQQKEVAYDNLQNQQSIQLQQISSLQSQKNYSQPLNLNTIKIDSYQNNKKQAESENNFYLKSEVELNNNQQDEIEEFTDKQGDVKMAQNLKYNSNSQNLEFSKSEESKIEQQNKSNENIQNQIENVENEQNIVNADDAENGQNVENNQNILNNNNNNIDNNNNNNDQQQQQLQQQQMQAQIIMQIQDQNNIPQDSLFNPQYITYHIAQRPSSEYNLKYIQKRINFNKSCMFLYLKRFLFFDLSVTILFVVLSSYFYQKDYERCDRDLNEGLYENLKVAISLHSYTLLKKLLYLYVFYIQLYKPNIQLLRKINDPIQSQNITNRDFQIGRVFENCFRNTTALDNYLQSLPINSRFTFLGNLFGLAFFILVNINYFGANDKMCLDNKKQALVSMSIFYLSIGYSIIGLFTIFGIIFGIYYCCKRPTHFHNRGEQLNNGICEKDIEKFKTTSLKKEDLNDLKIQECYICIVEYVENDKIINFECGHTFHLDCIKDWLKKNATCPSCRNDLKQQLKNIEKKKKSEISNDKDQIVLNVQP